MKKLEISWIRHSVSLANVKNIFEKSIKHAVFYYSSKDPDLVEDAVSGSCYLGKNLDKKISNNNLICCSEMKRTIQTAILMFPKQFIQGNIKVVPGIQEKGFGPGNIANDIEKNKILLSKWCFKNRKKDECQKLSKIFSDKEKIKKLVDMLYSDIDSIEFEKIREEKNVKEVDFLNCLIPYLEKKKIKKISIVSHSKYIREEVMVKSLITRKEEKFLRKDKKLYNNQILEKDYEYDKKKIYVRGQKIYDFGCVYEDRVVDCYH